MSRQAEIVEVFPMRLGSDILVDLTVEPAEEDATPPKPNDEVLVGDRRLKVWAVPAVSQPKGSRCFNVQFLKADLGGFEATPGMTLTWD